MGTRDPTLLANDKYQRWWRESANYTLICIGNME